MRSVRQIVITSTQVYAVCGDGTLWRSPLWEEGEPRWQQMEGPPEGDGMRKELTNEEVAEHLRKESRGMIIGKGKK